jgi:protein TonB
MVRFPISIFLALAANSLLLYLVHYLVSGAQPVLTGLIEAPYLEFVRIKEEPDPIQSERRQSLPQRSPPPQRPPQTLTLKQSSPPQPKPFPLDLPRLKVDLPSRIIGGPYLGDFEPQQNGLEPAIASDSLVPIVQIPPLYPPRALRAGIQGVVTAEFTITAEGLVRDIEIVAADPPKVFDRAVRRALRRWKFRPIIADGQAAERRARKDIHFKLNEP